MVPAPAKPHDLPTKLTADGASGTGDEHGAIFEVAGDGGVIHLDGRPTEQVFNDPQHPYTRSLLAAAPRLPDLNKKTADAP